MRGGTFDLVGGGGGGGVGEEANGYLKRKKEDKYFRKTGQHWLRNHPSR